MNTELKQIPLDQIRASKTNPRKDFTSPGATAYLAELADTIRARGVKQPAVVRPDYCMGTHTRAEIESRRHEPKFYELIFGECRLRASVLAGKPTLPCLPEEATDDDARETQQIENLQRRDLTALEEALGYEEMLTLKAEDGKSLRYTVETLAEKIGRKSNYIHKRRTLAALPDAARKALADGKLPVATAELIAGVPTAELRERFAKGVLKPQYAPGPLSYRDAFGLKQSEFVVSLKAAPFKIEDATLVKGAGACTGCPKMSGNCAHLLDANEANAHLKGRSCFDPECFRAKMHAQRLQAVALAAKEGKTLLDKADCERLFPRWATEGELQTNSGYVLLAAQPGEYLLKPGIKRVPSWKNLIAAAEEKTGGKVPVVLAEDQKGTLREIVETKFAIGLIEKAAAMVDSDVVIALIEKSAEDPKEVTKAKEKILASGKTVDAEAAARVVAPLFAKAEAKKAVTKILSAQDTSIFAKAGATSSSGGASSEQKAANAAAKKQLAAFVAVLAAAHAKLVSTWTPLPLWEAILSAALGHAGADGLWLISNWQGKNMAWDNNDKERSVRGWAKTLTEIERQALVPLLLVAQSMKWRGPAGSEDCKELVESLKLDVGAIVKKAAAAATAAKSVKATPKPKAAAVKPAKKKDAGAAALAAVKGSMPAKK